MIDLNFLITNRFNNGTQVNVILKLGNTLHHFETLAVFLFEFFFLQIIHFSDILR